MKTIKVAVVHHLILQCEDNFTSDDLESFINELNVDWEENWEGAKIVDTEMVEYETVFYY